MCGICGMFTACDLSDNVTYVPCVCRYKCIIYVLHNICCMCALCLILSICLCSYRGMHDCLVPVTPWLANVPSRARASDMLHILPVLSFLLHDLLRDKVRECKIKNPFDPIADLSGNVLK